MDYIICKRIIFQGIMQRCIACQKLNLEFLQKWNVQLRSILKQRRRMCKNTYSYNNGINNYNYLYRYEKDIVIASKLLRE